MKAKTFLLLLVLCGGCAADTGKGGSRTTMCKIVPPPATCAPARIPNEPKMTFNKNGLIAEPDNLCVPREEGMDAKVIIHITPENKSAVNTVFVFSKEPTGGDWLLGSNSDENDLDKIEINVPAAVGSGDYDFIIFDAGTGKCLDPRWEVQ